MRPDIDAALALLRNVRDELARMHTCRLYQGEPDVELDLDGAWLDLRQEHDAVCRAIALLAPDQVDFRDVLDDPNAPHTALSFEASPVRAGQHDLRAASAPAAG
jgi:hypothetical protein